MKHGVTDMTFFYSAAHNIFVSDINKTSYEDAGSWPEDAKEVSDELFYQYSQNPPKGKIRSHA
ncbi:tail fiber assembly protein, partial [Escherichia coli]|nr:tail fiber assembly protein [Escherichia coli]MDY8897609.1 tail fiber assembly protein [Escherichia coli]MDY9100682.1 tail fiber assembly protein [Escherichia coli]